MTLALKNIALLTIKSGSNFAERSKRITAIVTCHKRVYTCNFEIATAALPAPLPVNDQCY